jgi:hypothetical protein
MMISSTNIAHEKTLKYGKPLLIVSTVPPCVDSSTLLIVSQPRQAIVEHIINGLHSANPVDPIAGI